MFDRIATLVPANKTAAMVTSQSRDSAVADDGRTERHRNLIRLLNQCEGAIKRTADSTRKKALGQQKLRIQDAITKERGRTKIKTQETPQIFMNVAREFLSKGMFQTLMCEVYKRQAAVVPVDLVKLERDSVPPDGRGPYREY